MALIPIADWIERYGEAAMRQLPRVQPAFAGSRGAAEARRRGAATETRRLDAAKPDAGSRRRRP